MSISKSELWAKEDALNLAISRLPHSTTITCYREFLDDQWPNRRRREQIFEAAKMAFRGYEFLGIISKRLEYDSRRDGWTVRIAYREKAA